MDSSELTATLYFAAVVRVAADSSQTRLLPLDLLKEPLAPHENFSQRILLALQALEFIEPELTRSHATDWLFARDWIRHGFKSLGWRVLRPAPVRLTALADELASLLERAESINETFGHLVALWEDLALAETAEFARLALSRAGYDPRWADDAAPALQQALKHFGASQVMYLVHISLRSVALTHQRGAVPTAQLGHVLSTSIADYTQRAVAEKWAIKGMVRDLDRPRSAIASLFADTVTRLGPTYMSDPPSIEALVGALIGRHTVH